MFDTQRWISIIVYEAPRVLSWSTMLLPFAEADAPHLPGSAPLLHASQLRATTEEVRALPALLPVEVVRPGILDLLHVDIRSGAADEGVPEAAIEGDPLQERHPLLLPASKHCLLDGVGVGDAHGPLLLLRLEVLEPDQRFPVGADAGPVAISLGLLASQLPEEAQTLPHRLQLFQTQLACLPIVRVHPNTYHSSCYTH